MVFDQPSVVLDTLMNTSDLALDKASVVLDESSVVFSHLLYSLTVRVVGAPQMISQPVSSVPVVLDTSIVVLDESSMVSDERKKPNACLVCWQCTAETGCGEEALHTRPCSAFAENNPLPRREQTELVS